MLSKDPEARYDRTEAARFLTERGLKIASKTLAKYAVIGGGPAFEYWGRKPVYTQSTLLAWAESRLSKPVRSTSDRRIPASAA